jgi:polyisoprenyl-phosphate glycosyltransferase
MKAWFVTPVYRDVQSFLILRERLLEIRAEAGIDWVRFVVADDTAGQDPEVELLRALDDVVVLEPPFNLGHQRAIVFALRRALPEIADDDLIVTLDADGEDRPADLPRMIAPLREDQNHDQGVALAQRTERNESLGFKVMYMLFRAFFRALTGTTVRTGNFAAMRGSVARRALGHPMFDLAYSSTLLALDLPITYVPCPRGDRYEGESKMTFGRLSIHGLRMLMPFTERIAVRALAAFTFFLVLGIAIAVAIVFVKLFTNSAIPGWASIIALASLILSLIALGNFVTLFMLFSQTRAVSLSGVENLHTGEVSEPVGIADEAR